MHETGWGCTPPPYLFSLLLTGQTLSIYSSTLSSQCDLAISQLGEILYTLSITLKSSSLLWGLPDIVYQHDLLPCEDALFEFQEEIYLEESVEDFFMDIIFFIGDVLITTMT